MIRYAPFNCNLKNGKTVITPDGYLNLNYFNAADKDGKLNLEWQYILSQYGSQDCSQLERFVARTKYATKNKEAQWFMVSEMSTGYGKQIEKILKPAIKNKRSLNQAEIELVNQLRKKQTEYLNRALARISSEHPEKDMQLKSNGEKMPPVTLSEAHQYITDIERKPKMLHGTNSPLAWAVASLYKSLHQQAKTTKMLDDICKF